MGFLRAPCSCCLKPAWSPPGCHHRLLHHLGILQSCMQLSQTGPLIKSMTHQQQLVRPGVATQELAPASTEASRPSMYPLTSSRPTVTGFETSHMFTLDMTQSVKPWRWKAAGKVKLVVVGPNVAGQDGQGICGQDPTATRMLTDPNLDILIVPSQSAALLAIRDCPWLRPKLRVLANGVDEHFWAPSVPQSKRKTIVLYLKSGTPAFHDSVEAAVRAAGHQDVVRLKYGSYNKEQKKQLLSTAKALVLVSAFESQGLAAAEAWAMDVPVLAWTTFQSLKREKWHELPGSVNWFNLWSSTSPYLTPATGAFWTTPQNLTTILRHWDAWATGIGVSPRQWVLQHMMDKIAASNLLRLIHCEWSKQHEQQV